MDIDKEKLIPPIDPNLLNFYDKNLDEDYHRHTSLSKSEDHFSSEFYQKMLVFYLHLILTCMCYLSFALIAHSENLMSYSHMVFHVICTVLIPLSSVPIIFLVKRPKVFIRCSRIYFSTIGLVLYSYLILGNKYVMNSILIDSSDYEMPLGMGIIGFSTSLRFILLNNFASLITVNLLMIIQLLVVILVCPGAYTLQNFNEFFIVLIYIVLQTIDTQQTEFHMKTEFWQTHLNERSYRTSLSNKEGGNEEAFQTESELLIASCEKIKKTLKHACSVIIFKDIKDNLKLAQMELEGVKQRIGNSSLLKQVKIEQQANIDPEDKEFISQNYLDINFNTPPERSAVSELTVFEFKDFEQKNFPFKDYGVDRLESVLSQLGKNWSFDIWFVHDSTGHSISIIGKYLFEKWELNAFLNCLASASEAFFEDLENGYKNNPYHNSCHAVDVLHTMLFFIIQSNLSKSLNQLDMVCCIIAALGHDLGHPALTNRFLVNNKDPIAVRYNDVSVLENMHCAETFKLLLVDEGHIFSSVPNDDWLKSRKMIIEMILETDMSRHFEILGKFRTRVMTLSNIDITVFEDKCQVLGMALKCADIGHSAKDHDLHEKWSILVCEEFFRQGDLEKERGQTISMYCDRETTDIPKSQAGFIKNICLPLYEAWCFYLKSETVERFTLEQLKRNLEFWGSRKKRRSTVKSQVEDYRMRSETVKRILTSK